MYGKKKKEKKTASFSLSYCNQGHNLHQVGPLPYSPEQALMGARSSSTKIWGWAVTQRKCLNGSTIPEQGPTSDAKLAAMHGAELICIVGSSGQPDSGEGCMVLQSGPTCSIVAKFPQRSVVACSTQISCCKGGTLRTRPRTGVCEPDVVVPKAHQSYVTQWTYLRIHFEHGGQLHGEP